MKVCTLGIILGVVLVIATGTFAAVPGRINYQGTLVDSSTGDAITGIRDMTFYIYADSTGGVATWSEMHTSVEIEEGLFRVVLGSVTPIPSSIFDGSVRWITAQISPDGSELSPRQPLVTVPYSFRTDNADYAEESGHAVTADTAFYSYGAVTDADWIISGDDMYSGVSDDVGIGITTPSYPLHVVNPSDVSGSRAIHGEVTSTGTGSQLWGVYGQTNGSASTDAGAGVFGKASSTTVQAAGVRGEADGIEGIGVLGWATHTTGTNKAVFGYTSSLNGYAGYFQGGRNYFQGNVGIGIDTPNYKLHVIGNIYANGMINGLSLNTGFGNNELFAMNQNVRTSDAVTFSTVNTGQGANELYDMNQNVQTTDAVTFSTVNTGQGANELYGMNQDVRTSDDVLFSTVSTGHGNNELYAMNQDVLTTSSPTFATVSTGHGANELYAMNQDVLTTSDVSFSHLGMASGYVLGGFNVGSSEYPGADNLGVEGRLYVDGYAMFGESLPETNLHVYEHTNSAMGIMIENPNTGSGSVERLDFADENGTYAAIACYDDDNTSYPSQMRIFNNRPDGALVLSGGTTEVYIEHDGEVGVGTTSPDSKLDVYETSLGKCLEVTSTYDGSVGQLVNLERTEAVPNSGNDMLQIRVVSASVADMSFIECERGLDQEFIVQADGDVYADGAYTGPADFAEMIAVSNGANSVTAGDVLVIDPNSLRATVKSTNPRSTLVAGIYSTNPGFIGSERDWDKPNAGDDNESAVYTREEVAAQFNEIPMAVVGIVPCKVSAENGAITPGDLLVTSSTPGHAMRDDSPKAGTILGKALEPMYSGTGTIKVLVTLQ